MIETVTVPRDEWEWVCAMASLGGLLAAITANRVFSDEAPMGQHDIIGPHIHRLLECAGNDPVRRWTVTELEALLSDQPSRPFHTKPPGWLGAEPEC